MRISDWSSDVCSSDLATLRRMDAPDWAPSATTLRSVLRMIDGPAGRLVAASRRLDELSEGVAPFGSAEGISCVERRLRPEELAVIVLDGLAGLVSLAGAGLDGERATATAKHGAK